MPHLRKGRRPSHKPPGPTAIVRLLRARAGGWLSGLGMGVVVVVGLLAATMLASMVVTFFLHDI